MYTRVKKGITIAASDTPRVVRPTNQVYRPKGRDKEERTRGLLHHSSSYLQDPADSSSMLKARQRHVQAFSVPKSFAVRGRGSTTPKLAPRIFSFQLLLVKNVDIEYSSTSSLSIVRGSPWTTLSQLQSYSSMTPQQSISELFKNETEHQMEFKGINR